jgi:hypothetical protein
VALVAMLSFLVAFSFVAVFAFLAKRRRRMHGNDATRARCSNA